MRVAGAAGLVAGVLLISGAYLSTQGLSGAPVNADSAAWSAWARREEGAIEAGVYGLLVPGLLLFLWMFAGFQRLLPRELIATRLAMYGAVGFAVLFAVGGVVSSTAASAFGYQRAFEDPTGITVLWGLVAGFNLQFVGAASLAVTILASAVALRRAGALSSRLVVACIVLAILAVVGSEFGAGILFGVVWMVAVGVALLRQHGAVTANER